MIFRGDQLLGAMRGSPRRLLEVMHADGKQHPERPDWVLLDIPFTTSPFNGSPDDLPPIGIEVKSTTNVICKVLCLDWGGECVKNPRQEVIGVVLEVICDGRGGILSFQVDFRDDLGIQVLRIEDCKLWLLPVISEDEYAILDMMVEFIFP